MACPAVIRGEAHMLEVLPVRMYLADLWLKWPHLLSISRKSPSSYMYTINAITFPIFVTLNIL